MTADEIDVGLDFDQMGKAGTMLGSGGIVVLDETVSIVEFALRTIAFYQHEICGWCIPCREGTDWIKKTLTRVYNGGGTKKDVDNVQYLAENMMGRTFCPLGDAAAMPTLGFVKKFRKEFEDYIAGNKAGTPIITVEQLSEQDTNARRKIHRRRQTTHRPRRHAAHRGLQVRRHRDPRLLLLSRPLAAGSLPHVRRSHREDAEAPDRLHYNGR